MARRGAAGGAGALTARLRVRLTPGGGADKIDGRACDDRGEYLQARVRAAAENNEANRALEKLLAKALGLPRSKISVARGTTARLKTLAVEGVTEAELAAFVATFEEKA